MQVREYDHTDASSIFSYSKGLLNKSLTEALKIVDSSINPEYVVMKGKGGLGQLVEKFYYGYEPNSDPRPDFPEAGVELKTTPLKYIAREKLAIKERLVCDMIDFCKIVEVPFEESPFYRKSLLMLIIFYLHEKGENLRDLKFLFSVLWQLKEKDLLIIKHDYEVIINKIKEGKAHELSEGDTMYLGACRKGQKGESLRQQPFNKLGAPKRAFSLKAAYMRTILEFVQTSGDNIATNTNIQISKKELVSVDELKSMSFEEILTERLMAFKGGDCKQLAKEIGLDVKDSEKSRYARVTKGLLLRGLNKIEEAEEIKKAGIIVKTIRLEANGKINESMSFENIDYNEVYQTDNWLDPRWYEIATSRFMFVVYRGVEVKIKGQKNNPRYVLDKVFFWTMPVEDLKCAESFWNNIRENVIANTLQDDKNTYWKNKEKRNFHVRPKSTNSFDKTFSPLDGKSIPKKAYWFNKEYVVDVVKSAYASDWNIIFENKQKNDE